MRDAGRRPMGRLLYWALILVMATGFASGKPVPPQSGANTTTVADTVYLADECLNASTWAKGGTPVASSGTASN
jgi:hypothetical protein